MPVSKKSAKPKPTPRVRANRHGLPRVIPSSVKLEVRQRCGFGCVMCGSGLIEYHHFEPEFKNAKVHAAEGITLLCSSCHDKAGDGIISLRQVRTANASPRCKAQGFCREEFYMGNVRVPVRLGGSNINARSIIQFEDQVLLGFSEPEQVGSPIRLNARLTDSRGNPLLLIVANEWQANSRRFDVNVVGKQMTVRDAAGDIMLEIKLAAHSVLEIDRLNMELHGFKIQVGSDEYFTIENPQGCVVRQRGLISGDIGLLLKADGGFGLAVGAPQQQTQPSGQGTG